MISSNKNNLLFIILIALLLCNSVFTGILWLRTANHGAPEHMPPMPPDRAKFIIEKLGLDDKQAAQFKIIADEHFKKLFEFKEKEHSIKDSFFTLLKTDTADKKTVLYFANRAAEIQSSIDTLLFAHFMRLKAICNESQKSKLFEIVSQLQLRPHPGPSGRPDFDGNDFHPAEPPSPGN